MKCHAADQQPRIASYVHKLHTRRRVSKPRKLLYGMYSWSTIPQPISDAHTDRRRPFPSSLSYNASLQPSLSADKCLVARHVGMHAQTRHATPPATHKHTCTHKHTFNARMHTRTFVAEPSSRVQQQTPLAHTSDTGRCREARHA